MKHYFDINCFYKYQGAIDHERETKLEKLAKRFKGIMEGAGTNFKIRDILFRFETFRRAKQFYVHAHKRRWVDYAEIGIVTLDGATAYANIKELMG